MLSEGVRLNDTYTLVSRIGSGGGGIVYKAYHERLKTYVVVKQVRENVKGILDGRAEADILKNIKHSRLPRVYDFLELDGEIFTVMDYIEGMSLDKAIAQEGRFSAKEVFRWSLQLADALCYLHSQTPPIIHSDIKPANVMLTPERDICLIDFNVSLAFDQGMRTSTGVSGGYSPPEQYRDSNYYVNYLEKHGEISDGVSTLPMTGMEATEAMGDETQFMTMQGEAGERTAHRELQTMGRGVDERSDIYSLGATLYHLLTGVKPPVAFQDIVPIADFDIELGEGFRLILTKMMSLDPEERYQNGGELLYALEHVYELDSEYQVFYRKRKHRKCLIVALYCVGLLAVTGGWQTMKRETRLEYRQAVAQADELIRQEAFDQAEEKIQTAIALLPDRAEAYEKEIYRLYSMGDYEGAIRAGQAVIDRLYEVSGGEEDDDIQGDIFYLMGNAYYEQQDYMNAANFLSEAIGKNRKNNLYFRDYAVVLAKMGNIKEAENVLREAMDSGLVGDSIYMVQGEIAASKGEFDTAIECLNACIGTTESREQKRRAVLLCAQIYQQLGEPYLDEEIRLLEQAERTLSLETSMNLSEQLADAYARKAKCGDPFAQEYYQKALERFEKLYQSGYSTRQMMENIAIIYQQTERLEQAQEMLLKMAEAYPNDYRAYKRLAFLEADKQQTLANEDRNYGQMKQYYEKALELCKAEGAARDAEMQMLENMMDDLQKGGWL